MVEVVTVRDYTPEIAVGIGRLMPQLDPTMSSGLVSREELEKIILSPDRDQIIAQVGERIVGTCMVADVSELNWPAGYLGGMVVDAQSRGQGVGRKLLKAAFTWCIDRGIPRIGWYSEDDEFHAAAHRMYINSGAEVMAPYFEKVLIGSDPDKDLGLS